MRVQRWSLGLLLSSVALVALGCGSSKPVPVTGRVLLDGKPLRDATVTITPERERPDKAGPGHVATGLTDADGVFEATTYQPGDGVVPGSYRVTIAVASLEKPVEGYASAATPEGYGKFIEEQKQGAHNPPKRAQQKKSSTARPKAIYADGSKTPLRLTVPPPGEVVFDLKSEGH